MPFKVIFSIFTGVTFKGKNMLPMGNIFFSLIVAPLINILRRSKIGFDSTDTNILRVCLSIYCLLLAEFKIVFCGLIFL